MPEKTASAGKSWTKRLTDMLGLSPTIKRTAAAPIAPEPAPTVAPAVETPAPEVAPVSPAPTAPGIDAAKFALQNRGYKLHLDEMKAMGQQPLTPEQFANTR